MRISNVLIEAVKEFEGLRLTAYRCPSGVWTIGYGHTSGVTPGMKVNEGWATSALRQDLNAALKLVEHLNLPLKTQGQIDAVVDFVFNAGIGNFRVSTLKRLIMDGASDDEISKQFMRWVYGTKNGKKVVLEGLKRRREWESERWKQ